MSIEKPKRIHFAWLSLISFVLFNLGYVIDQTVRWTDHFQGLFNGVVHLVVVGFGWLFTIPWSLLIFYLYRGFKWKRFRAHWVLLPSVLVLVIVIGNLIFLPPTPHRRFAQFTESSLPENAESLHYHFSGGGLADYGDTYYFETNPDEVDRIISEMHLREEKFYSLDQIDSLGMASLSNCPDLSQWKGAWLYQGSDEDNHWFYYLITDSTRTKVYMFVACI